MKRILHKNTLFEQILTTTHLARKEAGRRRAAPHIKTYIRFADPTLESIEWALLTSANLSNQAWGGTRSAGEVWIKSYEIGVLVWPELFGKDAVMVPAFKTDLPKAVKNKVSCQDSLRISCNPIMGISSSLLVFLHDPLQHGVTLSILSASKQQKSNRRVLADFSSLQIRP